MSETARPTQSAGFEALAERAARRRRVELRLTVAAVALPAIVGAAVLGVSFWAVANARQTLGELRQDQSRLEASVETLESTRGDLESELAVLRSRKLALEEEAQRQRERITSIEADLDAKSRELEGAKLQLDRSLQFTGSVYNVGWDDAKRLAVEFGPASRALLQMSRDKQRGIGWSLQNTPRDGFNSPGYAVHVLKQTDQVGPDAPAARVLQTLNDQSFEPMPRATPRPGDIVVYETGYHMFYFRGDDGVDFVAGMTPEGIVAVKYKDFDVRPQGVLRIAW